jgi:hypothetical protein
VCKGNLCRGFSAVLLRHRSDLRFTRKFRDLIAKLPSLSSSLVSDTRKAGRTAGSSDRRGHRRPGTAASSDRGGKKEEGMGNTGKFLPQPDRGGSLPSTADPVGRRWR